MKSFSCRRIISISTDDAAAGRNRLSCFSTTCTAARSLPCRPVVLVEARAGVCAATTLWNRVLYMLMPERSASARLERVVVRQRRDELLDLVEGLGQLRHQLVVPRDALLVALLQELGRELARLEKALGGVGDQGRERGRFVGRSLRVRLEPQSDQIDAADQRHAADAQRRDLRPQSEPQPRTADPADRPAAPPQRRNSPAPPIITAVPTRFAG